MAVTQSEDGSHALIDTGLVISMFCGPVLFGAIRGGSFRRWVEPAAARPRPLDHEVVSAERTPEPVRYRIDVVPEDEPYAERLVHALDAVGHTRVDAHTESDADEGTDGPADGGNDGGTDDGRPWVFRFVSQFHDVQDVGRLDRTIPVLIADPDDDMPPRLQRRQWIDLRRGADQQRLDVIARHLDQPDKILQLIGSPPPHRQRVLPKGVQGLFVTAWVSAGAIIGYWFLLLVGLRSEFSIIGARAVVTSAAFSIVALAGLLWLTRKLRTRRRGRMRASLLPVLAMLTVAVGIPIDDRLESVEMTTEQETVIGNAPVALGAAMGALVIFWLFHSDALRRWIPSRSRDSTGDGTGRAGSTGQSRWSMRRGAASVGS